MSVSRLALSCATPSVREDLALQVFRHAGPAVQQLNHCSAAVPEVVGEHQAARRCFAEGLHQLVAGVANLHRVDDREEERVAAAL